MSTKKDVDGKLVLSDKQIDMAVQRIINKKKKHKTITFPAKINGEEVIVVKYRELIDLDKLSPSSRRKITKRYILRAFEESTVRTADGRTITVKSMGGAKKMTFKAKQRLAFYLEELVRNAIPSESRNDYENNRIYWHYYDSYILVEGIVYYWLINIKEADGAFNFYDLNKKKEVDMSATSNE